MTRADGEPIKSDKNVRRKVPTDEKLKRTLDDSYDSKCKSERGKLYNASQNVSNDESIRKFDEEIRDESIQEASFKIYGRYASANLFEKAKALAAAEVKKLGAGNEEIRKKSTAFPKTKEEGRGKGVGMGDNSHVDMHSAVERQWEGKRNEEDTVKSHGGRLGSAKNEHDTGRKRACESQKEKWSGNGKQLVKKARRELSRLEPSMKISRTSKGKGIGCGMPSLRPH